MKHLVRWLIAGLVALALGGAFLFLWEREDTAHSDTITIAVPYEEALFAINDSDYTAWLEAKLGQEIEFVFLQPNYTTNYLQQILSDPATEYDAVFFTQNTAPTTEQLNTYIASGGIAPLEEWIDTDSGYFSVSLQNFSEYDLRKEITHTDGHIYYIPALDASSVSQSAQTMWVNVSLLEEVGLTLPRTTEEFTQMLAAFAAYDSALAPIIGTSESSSYFPLYFLMNSFVTCDTQNHFLYLADGTVTYAPASDAWRAGLDYCHQLFEAGLLPQETFTYSADAFIALCNDPDNLVGCFTTDSISNVLSEKSPALLSRYLAVSPLESGLCAPVALATTPLPRVGGIVLSSSDQQAAVCALMDVMCSEEGYLRAHYGTPELDWTAAAPEDITVNGDKAVITVTKAVGTISDTDHDHVLGPYIASTTYADMVAWKGYQVNQSAYLDARAYRTYEYYAPTEALPYLQLTTHFAASEALDLAALDAFVLQSMIYFVCGEWEIESDADWQAYLDALDAYQLEVLVAQAEDLYQAARADAAPEE